LQEIGMGGKASYVSIFTREAYSDLKAKGYHVAAAAELSFRAFSGGASVDKAEHSNDYHAFVAATHSTRQVCVGAGGTCPPKSADQDPSEWVKAVREDPLPLRYELMELWPMLSPAFFPDDPAILDRQAALVAFLADHYCGDNRDCQSTLPSKDGYWLASANLSCSAYLDGTVTGLAAASHGRSLYVTGGPSGTLCIFDLQSNAWSEGPAMREARWGHGVALLPDPTDPTNRLLYALGGGQGTPTTALQSGDEVSSVAVTPNGRTIVSGSVTGKIKVWDLASGASLRTLVHDDYLKSVAVTPDGRTIISGSGSFDHDKTIYVKTIKVWDIASGACLRTLVGHSRPVYSVAVTPDGRTIVSASDDKTIKVWDLASGACLRTLVGDDDEIWSVAVTPDGRTIISGSGFYDKTIKVWDLTSGACLRTLVGHDHDVRSVAVTPDGRTIVSGSDDKTIKVWDLASGSCLRTLVGHAGFVESVAITPDGRTIVSGSYDKTIKVWDLASGACLTTLHGHSSVVYSVAITPDGRTIVSGSSDHTIRLWYPGYPGALGSMEAYDLHGRRWVGGLASLATARSQHGVTAYLNSSILALGGLDASNRTLSSVELYSSEQDRWSSFPPMTTPRAGPAVVAVPGSPVVYVFGGRDGEGRVLSSVERFDGSEWRVFGSMKRPRAGHAASLTGTGTTIHVYGGSDGDGQPQNTVEVFDAATGAWLRFGPKMNKPRGQVCADVISEARGVETLVVVGQRGGDERACEALTLLVE
jgi:WD40 repeat protein